MTIHVERETDTERIERCDHDGTTEPLAGLSTVLGPPGFRGEWSSWFPLYLCLRP
jgi:hypothetical protein